MAIDREAVYSRLWELAAGSAQFATASRRLRHWTAVTPAEQPALFMSQKHQEGATHQGAVNAPVVWTLYADFYIYVHTSDPHLAPATLLNPLVDAVERALSPLNGPAGAVLGYNNLDLDGMVMYARIQGRIETDEGVLGDQAIAVIPVEVMAV